MKREWRNIVVVIRWNNFCLVLLESANNLFGVCTYIDKQVVCPPTTSNVRQQHWSIRTNTVYHSDILQNFYQRTYFYLPIGTRYRESLDTGCILKLFLLKLRPSEQITIVSILSMKITNIYPSIVYTLKNILYVRAYWKIYIINLNEFKIKIIMPIISD